MNVSVTWQNFRWQMSGPTFSQWRFLRFIRFILRAAWLVSGELGR